MTLLERLQQIRKASGMTDRQFAIRLGISPGNWSLICKAGRGEPNGREIGMKVLAAVLREYPSMKPYVLEYILEANPVEVAETVAA